VERPPEGVVLAFGGDPDGLVSLAGGRGTSWRAGTVVLKPAGRADELAWTAAFVEALRPGEGFRVPRQLQGVQGRYANDGWAATEWLDGEHRDDRWDETLVVARRFHHAAAHAEVDWPPFMAQRTDPWSLATRIAWGEGALPSMPSAAANLVDTLRSRVPAHADLADSQVIHSDLAGNVLFAEDAGRPPAVIDISAQHRTACYADAVLVADAVAWNGAPVPFVERFVAESPDRVADVARAVIFRVATAALLAPADPARVATEADAYRRLLPALQP
jgi:uncharacterized protein (TIGR02569 family)